MTKLLTIVLAVLLTGSTDVAATEVPTVITTVVLGVNYDTTRNAYLQRYVSVQDVWAGWVPAEGDVRAVNIVTGRVMNMGKKPVIVNEVLIALLDTQGKVLEERPIIAYPERAVWQPQLGPGESAGFNELLPPSNGVVPMEWTGEVRVTVTSIELP